MPVRWTGEIDQWLLIQILEMLDVKINEAVADRIIKAWPAKFGGKPTRRAIQDHIRKLKTEAPSAATPKTDASAGGFPRTVPSTPSKTAPSTVRKNTGTGSRRKRKTHEDSDSDQEYYVGRKEVNDLTGSPTPGSEAVEESPRKRRAASKRVSELIKKIYESEPEDEDEDIEDADSEGSKIGSDGDGGYVDAEEELVEDTGKVSAGVAEDATADSEMLVEGDTGDAINVKNELELEV